MWTITPEEWTAIILSLRVAAVATIASLPVGVATAYCLARYRFPGRTILEVLVYLPLVLPPVVTGYALLLLFGRHGPIGAALYDYLGVTLSFRWTGAALAAAIMAFPLLVRSIRISIDAIDRQAEEAAATLGAPPIWVFLTISLPLALPGIIAGTTLAFAKALGEFGATITFVAAIPGETQTIPAAIYTLTQTPDGDLAAVRLSLISVVIAICAVALSEYLARTTAHEDRRGT